MSKEQAKEFFEAISKDKQLAEEVKQVVGGRTSNEVKAKALFDLARGHGFNFSKNEAISLTRDELKTSLKIESLSDVSGGAKGSIKPAVMAAFLLAGMGVSGAAMSNMEASAAPPKVQAEQSVNSYDVYTADDFVNFFTRKDYQGQATRGVTITLHSDISLTAEQAGMVSRATNLYNPEPGNPHDMSFHGTLDGGGHSITLNFTEPVDGFFGGLFAFTNGATFHDLHVRFDRITGIVTSALVGHAYNSNFDNVVVTGDSLTSTLPEVRAGTGLHGFGVVVGDCSDCDFANCAVRIRCADVSVSDATHYCFAVGGLAGCCCSTRASACAFSGTITVSSPCAVRVGGIFGDLFTPPNMPRCVVDSCVVSDSRVNANSGYDSAAGAIVGSCFSGSVVRSSAALNCSIDATGNYPGQLIGASVPVIGDSSSGISYALEWADPNAPSPDIYGCFHTNEGPAVGRERRPNPSAATQQDQDSIISLLPDLAPVIGRLQNPQGQQTGLVSGVLKWVGSWFGLGGKK